MSGGLGQIFNTAWSGLDAASQQLATVADNTANVNTPGYNVESVQQTEAPGPPGAPGEGTSVTSIQRSFNQFIFSQMVSATSANQAAQVVQSSAQTLSAIFPVTSGGQGGLGATLTSFFGGMANIAQDPTSIPNRQSLISDAQSLAADFNSVGGQLASNLSELNGQLQSSVTSINSLTQQIANLNLQIISASQAGTSPPNALMDNRDELVQQLGQQLGITVISAPSNSLDIYTTGGQVLVGGGSSDNLAVTSGSYGGGSSLSIVYQPSGQNITDSLSGGTIGGVLTAQSQVVSAQNTVGALAVAVSSAINQQQSLGLDLNGSLGTSLFSVAGPQVIADTANTGSGTLTAAITNPTAFVPANFIIAKTTSGYEATNTTTGQVTALGNGPNFSLDGMSLTVSGTINTGDTFELEPTAAAAQTFKVVDTDPSTIAAASPYVATPGANLGDVTASTASPASSGSLSAGTPIIPASEFGQNLTIKFTSPTTFNVLSASNAVLASGSFSTTNGAEVAITYPSSAPAGEVAVVTLSSGTAATGDTFSLTPGGPDSNGNIVAMSALSSQNLLSSQTLTSAYATLVSQVGSAGQSANFSVSATQGVLNQVQAVQQSISGVNLDEQAADLVNFQQAYQASAQVIATTQTLFQGLITAMQATS